MESKFSEEVKIAIARSRTECLNLGYDAISTEMLILGMLRTESTNRFQNNGAVKSLQSIGVKIDYLCRALEAIIASSMRKAKSLPTGNVPLTRSAEKALKLSYQTALRYGDLGQIDTIHFLISTLEEINLEELTYLQEKLGFSFEDLKANIYLDGAAEKKTTTETQTEQNIEEQLKASKEKILRLKDVSMKLRSSQQATSPLSLYFNTEEYSNEEIKEIISLLSELYHNHSGDDLVIRGMSQFDIVNHLACV
uniref:hypothetical protein n=1 Tax=Pedobacter schmidteae TaxID=2201271 RepID=UPI000EB58BA9|nr:hypothetical protein [Pedobacter schmidteae]